MAKCCLCGGEDAEHVIERQDTSGQPISFHVHVICAQLLEFEHDAEFKQQELAWRIYKRLDQAWVADRPPSVDGAYWLRVDERYPPTVLEVCCRARELQVFEGDMDREGMPMGWMPLSKFWEGEFAWQAVAPWVGDKSAEQ